jgi:anti-sigma regulatory factor (Ser/Thr protein kinase)
MAMKTDRFPVTDPSQVSGVRRAATALAEKLGFNESRAGQVALIVSELASNVVKHARDGELLLSQRRDGARRAIEVLALDRGPGMTDFEQAVRDGYSTAGSSGHGLGAISRQADQFELFSQPRGTVALARIWNGNGGPPDGDPFEAAGISVPKPGEQECGDDWAAEISRRHAAMFVVDGLGHGAPAAEAAAHATAVFAKSPLRPPAEILQRVHEALRPTRGGAVAIASVDLDRSVATFAGLGNIGGAIVSGDARRGLVSHNGTAGHTAARVQEFSYPMDSRASMVLFSDGLGTQWNPADYPGLWQRDPALVAGVLYRDFSRRRDDVTVVVGRARIR